MDDISGRRLPTPSIPPPVPDAGETRAAVATTVAWMLLALSCASAQAVALVVWLLARAAGLPPNRPNALLLVVSTLLGVAILTGLAILVFTPIVYRVRKSRPPTAITIAALIIALAPILTLSVLGFLTSDL